MPFLDAGPWQDATVCSQMATVTRLAATATPDRELDPRGTRSVSYGLQAWPDQLLMACPPGHEVRPRLRPARRGRRDRR